MNSAARRWASVCIVLAACGGGQRGSVGEPPQTFETADIEPLREHAPALIGHAETARERALAAHDAGDEEAAGDYASAARLWLDAARAEGELVELRETIATREAEAEALVLRTRDANVERRELDAQARRRETARVAAAQLQAAYEQASRDEPRRHRRRSDEIRRARAVAARTLNIRTRLALSAAVHLGARQEEADAIERRLEDLSADLDERLQATDAAYRDSLRLLGEARRSLAISDATVGSLIEAAQELGLEPALGPEAVHWRLHSRIHRQSADILRQFPHGPAQVVGQGARSARRSLVQAGVPEDRITANESDAELVLELPAYGRAAR